MISAGAELVASAPTIVLERLFAARASRVSSVP